MTHHLVVIRHGHSEWNLTERFTGWTDITLTEIGLNEAEECGRTLSQHGYQFDEVHISVLRRTRQTAEALLKAAAHPEVPLHSSWRLNERHYGQLQGMNKRQIFESWGEEISYRWWRGFTEPPPPLESNDPRHPRFDPLYNELDPELLPRSESLEQCQQRLIPYWQQTLSPRIQAGKKLLIVSHGNTLRSLRMHLENINPEEIEKVEIPSGVPLIYHFDNDMTLIGWEWLKS